jgi:hypothetical protein
MSFIAMNICFEEDLSPEKIVSSMEFHLDTDIDISKDLVFFDEVQDCPRAITSLKYFQEEMPELALVCAGSLLGVVHSDSAFPVGKVSFLNLYPLSFEEFLLAAGDRKSCKVLDEVNMKSCISEIVHYHLLERLKEYMITGGMPEVISVFESIPAHLLNKKFVSSRVIQGGRFSRLRSSIDWLIGAGLLIKVKITNSGELPFAAFSKENNFKLYLFDIGLLGALGSLSPNVIYKQNDLFATFKGAFCEMPRSLSARTSCNCIAGQIILRKLNLLENLTVLFCLLR